MVREAPWARPTSAARIGKPPLVRRQTTPRPLSNHGGLTGLREPGRFSSQPGGFHLGLSWEAFKAAAHSEHRLGFP
jgi:hypothetical protein